MIKYLYALLSPINIVGLNFMRLSKEDMLVRFEQDERINSQMQLEIWDSFGTGLVDEFRPYLTDLFHETNRWSGNALNTIENLFWYRKEKPDQASRIEESLWRYYLNFIRGLQNIEIFYTNIFLIRKNKMQEKEQ